MVVLLKAVLCTRYATTGGLELRDVETPKPAPGEALVRIRATSVTMGDWRVRTLTLPRGFGALGRLALGLRAPRKPILGTELSGVVEAVGTGVAHLRAGDEVIAAPGAAFGCHAEYRCVRADAVATKPAAMSFEEAATLPFGATTALHFLRRARLAAGERVLVHGASGSVGSAAVQLAKHMGAGVTAVASTANVGFVRSLGADHVIDRTREDLRASGAAYDVIVDAVGTLTCANARGSLREGGRLLLIAADLPETLRAPFARGGKRVLAGPAPDSPALLRDVVALAEGKALRSPVDAAYPLARIEEAYAHVGRRQKRGNVAVTVAT